ncbi:MAG: hypothetical protein ACREXT_15490 [Gammaproteobacteria bacterium]
MASPSTRAADERAKLEGLCTRYHGVFTPNHQRVSRSHLRGADGVPQ